MSSFGMTGGGWGGGGRGDVGICPMLGEGEEIWVMWGRGIWGIQVVREL